jgi:alpha-1,2-mannosyltransferase
VAEQSGRKADGEGDTEHPTDPSRYGGTAKLGVETGPQWRPSGEQLGEWQANSLWVEPPREPLQDKEIGDPGTSGEDVLCDSVRVRPSAVSCRVVLAAALTCELAVLIIGLGLHSADRVLYIELGSGAAFGIALLALARARLRAGVALLLVIGVGALLQLVALTSPPTASDDVNRYVWDAQVQLSAIDPYRYPPSDPALDELRTSTLFPGRSDCRWTLPNGDCSLINRPTVRTVYPPIAELAFTAARIASAASTDGPGPLQVFGAIGVLAVAALLGWRAIRQRMPCWTVAIWAWCPVTAIELTNNAHIDWLAVLLSVAALMAGRAGHGRLAGVAIGAAIATKLYPGLLLPVLIRRRPRTVLTSAIAVLALSYLPHVAAVGAQVIGYLPGYLREENYLEGSRFALIGAVLPAGVAAAAAVLVMITVMVVAARRVDERAPEEVGLVVVGIALLVATPAFSWYCVLLLGLVAMTGKVEWLPAVFASGIAALGAAHFGDPTGYRTACYAVAFCLLLLGITAKRKIATRQARPEADGAAAALDPTSRLRWDERSRLSPTGRRQPGRP